MAKKKRKSSRKRSKKNKVTYDSKETLTIAGLALIVMSIVFLVSIFTTSSNPDNIFVQVQSIFGSATVFAAIFLFTIALRLLGLNKKVTSIFPLFAQGMIYLLLAGLFTARTATGIQLQIINDGAQTGGGHVGYFIIRNLFGSAIPTEPITQIVLFVLILFFLPIAVAMSPKSIVETVSNLFTSIFQFGKKISDLTPTEESIPNVEVEPNVMDQPKASKLGDFNNLIARRKAESSATKPVAEEAESESDMAEVQKLIAKAKEDGVQVKQGDVGEDGLIQEALQFPGWKLPPLSLLNPVDKTTKTHEPSIKENAHVIEQILESFNVEATVEDHFVGPSVVQYALNIPLGVKVQKISNLAENIALALGVDSKAVRIESIPETTYLGIEVPRSKRDLVSFKELMLGNKQPGKMLPVPVGKDIGGDYVIADITDMPHLLIAGATGSGKSVVTNSFISSMLMKKTPDELKLILVDPKQVELIDYNGIPHLLTPVITEMEKVVNALKWAVAEMETRYTNLAEEQVRNIGQYNEKKGFAALPYIVIVIDEMADMMMTAGRVEAETAIVRLAQKARAVGIHLILATQRPSVNVITGIIKANIPGRIGMSVTSSTDSRVILDRNGAEALMGKGDLLYKAPDSTKALRLQGPFVDQQEVIRLVDYIKAQAPEVEYIESITEKNLTDSEAIDEALGEISGDDLVENAIRIVVRSKKGSASLLQRKLSIGFNRAARLLDELEEAGVVGPPNGPKPREVLIDDADTFIQILKENG